MDLLLVEDDERKREHICAFLEAHLAGALVDVVHSYRSALLALVARDYDFVILDMTIPTFDVTPNEPGGRPHAYGGRELLHQMKRKMIATPVVVITQYEQFGEGPHSTTLLQLDADLRERFGEQYHGVVHYSPSVDVWKERLASLLEPAL